MKLIIDIEPGKPVGEVMAALFDFLRAVKEARTSDPDLDMCVELADPEGRAMAVRAMWVINPQYEALIPYLTTELEAP